MKVVRRSGMMVSIVLFAAVRSVRALQTMPIFCHDEAGVRRSAVACRMSSEPIYITLASGSHVAEIEVKKSRFLGYASHVDNWQEAQAYLAAVKGEHPKARHWCYGFCGGINPVNERCSDDGEPSGTAGPPILNAIHGEAISDTICVVVRYFGGVKLGAGGLIRAYGGAARLVLRDAPIIVLIPKSTVRVTVDMAHIGTVYELIAKVEGICSDELYGVDGSLAMSITCETNNLSRLRKSLNDATRGSAIILML